MLFRTTFGYKLRTVGLSRGAADYAGIAWGSMVTKAMFLSGALGGLAGVTESVGLLGRHYGTSAGYGFTAIAVGLVGRNHPLGVVVTREGKVMPSVEPAVIRMAQAVEFADVDHFADMRAVARRLKCHGCNRNLTTKRAFS